MDKTKLVDLITAAQNGDPKALEALYYAFNKQVYYLAYKIMGRKEDAEDITQEVFITVCDKIADLQEPKAFPRWLNRITANKCTDTFRKKAITATGEADNHAPAIDFAEETDPHILPELSTDNIETQRMIVEIVDNLPDIQRLCVYYYYYENLTVAQIAENLEANENTVKNRLYRARESIRRELERLNQEDGIKLYTLVPLPLTPVLRAPLSDFTLPAETAESIWKGVAAVISVGTAAAGAGAAQAVTTAVNAAKTAALSIKAKIAMAAAGVVVTAGVAAGVLLSGADFDYTGWTYMLDMPGSTYTEQNMRDFERIGDERITSNGVLYNDGFLLGFRRVNARTDAWIDDRPGSMVYEADVSDFDMFRVTFAVGPGDSDREDAPPPAQHEVMVWIDGALALEKHFNEDTGYEDDIVLFVFDADTRQIRIEASGLSIRFCEPYFRERGNTSVYPKKATTKIDLRRK